MREQVEYKLQHNGQLYTDDEVKWLMCNIGNPDGDIRDTLVFTTVARGLYENLFTREQVNMMIQELLSNQLLLHDIDLDGQATLTRSFAALWLSVILRVDTFESSIYYRILSEHDFIQIWDDAISFLEQEHDFCGYSAQYGWVHVFAHGADLLESIVLHPLFDGKNISYILTTMQRYFERLHVKPVDNEEYRMAMVIISAYCSGILTEDVLINWLNGIQFATQTNEEYYRWETFQSFCLVLYVEFNQVDLLTDELKRVLYKHIKTN